MLPEERPVELPEERETLPELRDVVLPEDRETVPEEREALLPERTAELEREVEDAEERTADPERDVEDAEERVAEELLLRWTLVRPLREAEAERTAAALRLPPAAERVTELPRSVRRAVVDWAPIGVWRWPPAMSLRLPQVPKCGPKRCPPPGCGPYQP